MPNARKSQEFSDRGDRGYLIFEHECLSRALISFTASAKLIVDVDYFDIRG